MKSLLLPSVIAAAFSIPFSAEVQAKTDSGNHRVSHTHSHALASRETRVSHVHITEGVLYLQAHLVSQFAAHTVD